MTQAELMIMPACFANRHQIYRQATWEAAVNPAAALLNALKTLVKAID
jgi:hypothetical protein